MKTALILLSILGMACAFSMKNLHRRVKIEDSEENGVFKYRPRYYLYKHAYFYPPLKRFPVQGSSDSSEENGDDSSEEEEEEEETSNEGENNEESNEDEDSEAENTTLSATTLGYGEDATPGTWYTGLAAIQLPKKAGDITNKATKKEESDEEEEEEEEENENEESEAEVDENEQGINGTSTNSTEAENGNGSSGGDNGEEGEEESVTGANTEGTTATRGQDKVSSKTTTSPNGGFEPTTPPQVYRTTSPPFGKTTTVEYEGEYEYTGTNEYDNGYEVYESENGEPRGDNYRAYEDEYSYFKGQGYDSYDGQNYYHHQ
ncbi:bone sialoprotein 2 [Rhinopithecus roxellana]|uniref:Integrin-binding sialoprotein n=1 Tax=Rhinopithecus roxellana TaxID=61622 RepID=A0A2K6Q4M6_RHIRO|nr:bone sialoprotein 2 [Rhinopithecus roxellana]